MPFQTNRVAGALGAEISGVDLGQDLDEAAFGAIKQALLTHGAIFLLDQIITPGQRRRMHRMHRITIAGDRPY